MEELYLVRHGQAAHLLEGMVGGWSDSPLTELGREQARRTGRRLKQILQENEFRFYCSDLSRAYETASILESFLGQKPTSHAELRELNNGAAANKSKEEAAAIQLRITKPLLDWIPYPEAESWNMMQRRVCRFMSHISNSGHRTTVIVSHANTINSIIYWWLEFNPETMEKVSFEIDPCSITHLTVTRWSNSKTVTKLNDTGHLIETDS